MPRRRSALVAALALTLVATATACGGSGATLASTEASTASVPTPSPPTSTVAEGGLDLAVPAGVFSQHVIDRFQRQSGCQVAVQGWSESSDAAASGLRRLRGTIDLVAVRSDTLRPLAVARLVQPLGTGSIDGYGGVASRLRSLPGDSFDGNVYAVPYAWHPIALLSRDDAFPDGPPTSLRALWEPAHASTIAIPDDPLTLASAALEVGVDDPFALHAADLSAAYELLRLARVSYRSSSDAALEALFRTGGVTLALGDPRVATALAVSPAVSVTIPSEGAVGLVSTFALASGAPHPVCAYRFLSFMLQPVVQAAIGAVSQLTPAVKAACRPLGRRACARLHATDQWGSSIEFARRPVTPDAPWSAWLADWRALG